MRTVQTQIFWGKVGGDPNLLHFISDRSRGVMALSAESFQHATIVGEREGVPQLQTEGLGVTEATIDVFNNFVKHIAVNAPDKGTVQENPQERRPQLRRTKRFAATIEAEAPCLVLLRVPLQQKVQSEALCRVSMGEV